MLAFIPNEDGTQLDVLFLNVPHGHQISDGTGLTHHMPLLIARAGNCTGDCPKRDGAIAAYLFNDKTSDVAKDALEAAVANGAAWQLDSSDLVVRKGSSTDPDLPALSFRTGLRTSIIPTTATQRGDYTWLAALSSICPACGFNTAVLGSEPPSSLVTARLRLHSGNVFTYSVARIGTDVTPVHFKRLDGQGSVSSYSQAIASWMAADIEVSGDDIEIAETKFDGTPGRAMTLAPDSNDRIEIAMLNLPPLVPVAPTETPGIGKHFERYYDLTANPPAAAARLVPQPGAAPGAPAYSQVTWTSVHPTSELASDLLNAIRLNVGRTAYEIALCPPLTPSP
jgi:hypothetical protein